MKNKILSRIAHALETQSSFQPVLFLGNNTQLLNHDVHTLVSEIMSEFGVDKNFFFCLPDNQEKIKVAVLRDFFSKANVKSSFAFQVFLIENISRMTPEGFNSCLKILEEPGQGNLIFLTNASEAGILDTVLSRVQTIHTAGVLSGNKNDFFTLLLDDYIHKRNVNLLTYFFQDKKIEKSQYIQFLFTCIAYIQENFIGIDLLDDIEQSIQNIEKNNVLAKYEVDKLLLKL